MTDVFVGLGSNLDEPAEKLRNAVLRLADLLHVERVSSVYRTEPVGLRNQPDFLNAVLMGRTDLAPRVLLDELHAIEDEMGRRRRRPSGPRTIDVDLLLYGDQLVHEKGLSVPHPRMTGRRFVLVPLAEIAPDVLVPGCEARVSELLARLPATESVELASVPGWPPTGTPGGQLGGRPI